MDSMQLAGQRQSAAASSPNWQQGNHVGQSPVEAVAVLERATAEAGRLTADNAALRSRLSRTHKLVGAMQVSSHMKSVNGRRRLPRQRGCWMHRGIACVLACFHVFTVPDLMFTL